MKTETGQTRSDSPEATTSNLTFDLSESPVLPSVLWPLLIGERWSSLTAWCWKTCTFGLCSLPRGCLWSSSDTWSGLGPGCGPASGPRPGSGPGCSGVSSSSEANRSVWVGMIRWQRGFGLRETVCDGSGWTSGLWVWGGEGTEWLEDKHVSKRLNIYTVCN